MKLFEITHKKVDNIYILYEITLWSYTRDADFTLGNSFFGVIKLTKNPDPNKYKHSSYDTGFDAHGSFSL